MFTRVVEITAKSGKARELSRTISDKVLTLLRSQPGFLDEVLLISNTDPDRVMSLSFWKTQEDAAKRRLGGSQKSDVLLPISVSPHHPIKVLLMGYDV